MEQTQPDHVVARTATRKRRSFFAALAKPQRRARELPGRAPSAAIAAAIRRQAGYLLMELSLTLAVASIIQASQLSQVNSAIEQSFGVETGHYLANLQAGMNQYIMSNWGALSTGAAVGNGTITVANAYQPTLAELIQLGYMPQSTNPISPLGLQFVSKITPQNCPGNSCTLYGLAYSTTPFTDGSGLRTDVLGAAVQAVGVDAGMSYAATPGVMTGFANSWGNAVANPVPGNPAGILAVKLGTTSGLGNLLNQLYWRVGDHNLTGPMDANGQNINNVANLNATGDVRAGGTVAAGGAVTAGTSVQANTTVAAGTSVTAGTTLQAGNIATAGAPCSGGIGASTDGRGLYFQCQDGRWVPLGGHLIGYQLFTVQNGWGVPVPSCPGAGTPAIIVNPKSFYVDTTATVNISIAGTGPWTVYITDGSGSGIPGSATAATYCAY
ncbi:hypothetical protein E2P84_42395 [Burkholderia cepacia]|uniref:Shufflon system plasmid conjugative transfer pilus tip adhesin PilV n=1 Tax=Burkholderia cepacia TaxID=292 RepID=A0AAX2RN85_BURCE|nr:hypothetical protein [Burkholderia cepacia]TES62208.1 hypothetical protein E2P84_42395 [Burkholderia cepacia]TET01706.1 hypothetical protein E3D36_16865 [Burkholderia cepacia]TEU47564.1 hypothetical protein E3D37_16295 [Burkholderia cepacia]TEU53436.1 hypothetical protein E3D38_11880 [Burkholderia cepacia]TEV02197.1 hypothetical protein E3D40_13615 [Burkholderia cepacia]